MDKFNKNISRKILACSSLALVAIFGTSAFAGVNKGNAPGEPTIYQGVAYGNNSDGTGKDKNDVAPSTFGQTIAIGGGNLKPTRPKERGDTTQPERHGREGAFAYGDQSIAIGGDTRAIGNSSIAIGGDDLDKVANTNNVRYNDQSVSNEEFNNSPIAMDYNASTGKWLVDNSTIKKRFQQTTTADGAVAVGVSSKATGVISTALGAKSMSDGNFSVAVGVGSHSSLKNSVALGAGSDTATNAKYVEKATIKSLDKNGKETGQSISYGDRHKFAGNTDTQSGDQVSVGSVGHERQIKNVSAGAIDMNSTDAINGSQLAIVAGTLQGQINNIDHNVSNLNTNVVVTENAKNIRLKPKDKLTFEAGKNLSSSLDDNGVLKVSTKEEVEFKKVTLKDGTNQTDLTSTSQGLDVGGDTITNVGSGLKDKDGNKVTDLAKANQTNAVNVGDLLAVKNLAKDKSIETVSAGDGVKVKESAGAKGKDYQVSVAVDELTTQITGTNKAGDKIVKVGDKFFTVDKDGKPTTTEVAPTDVASTQVSAKTANLALEDNKIQTPKGDEALALVNAGNVANAINKSGHGILDNNDFVKTNGADGVVNPGDNVQYKNGQGTIASVIAKKDAKGVETYEISYDVNIDNDTIVMQNGKLTAVAAKIDTTTGDVIGGVATVGDKNAYLNAGEVSKLVNETYHIVEAKNTDKQVEKKDGSVQIKAGDTLHVEAGKNINASMNKDGKLEISTSRNVEFDNVKVGGVSINKDKGIDAGGTNITNVAPGVKAGDAVNYAQLEDLSDRLKGAKKESKAGIAGSAAFATLGQPRNSGDNAFSAGVASHEGQTALAVGVSSWSDNGRWLLKGAAAVDTQKQTTVGGSVTYNW